MFNLLLFLIVLFCVRPTIAVSELNSSVSELILDATQTNILEIDFEEADVNQDIDDHRQHIDYDAEMWMALSALNLTEKNLIDFNAIDGKEETANNIRTTVLFFTRYCGPGSRLWNKLFKSDERTYMDVDYCCKMHDECPYYVEKFDDYTRYPGLEFRPQFFSRCLKHTEKKNKCVTNWQIVVIMTISFFAFLQIDYNANAMWISIDVWTK